VSIAGVDTDGFWIANLGLLSFAGLGVICTVAEVVKPAHKLRYRKVVPPDVVAFVVYQLIVFPAAVYVCLPVTGLVRMPSAVFEVPLALRVIALYLFADLGSYWMHRLLHTRHAWRMHRWHHSPTRMYWLAGVRATIPQQILFNLPGALAVPIIADAPLWLFSVMIVEGVARNHWMHMNVTWRSSWIEWVFVTPRYHHIHHSADAALHDGNYGSLFTIWDRLFGTYLDPDVTKPRAFGTGENKRDPVLLMIGI
jgi:sterol desaturase/sphingolipid hydroxylase (fatty acid hydroxylase superfamily)